MKKSVLEAVIEDKWSDDTTVKRVPSDDRDVGDSVVEAMYSDVISDTQATSDVLTPAVGGFTYALKIWRAGGTIFINGTLTGTGGTLAATDLITISNTDYLPATGTYYGAVMTTAGDTAIFTVSGNKIAIVNSITDTTPRYINLQYPALD